MNRHYTEQEIDEAVNILKEMIADYEKRKSNKSKNKKATRSYVEDDDYYLPPYRSGCSHCSSCGRPFNEENYGSCGCRNGGSCGSSSNSSSFCGGATFGSC